MSCKSDGLCRTAAICFALGCADDRKKAEEADAAAKASDARYRQGYSDGWREGRAAQRAAQLDGGQGDDNG